MNSVEQTTGRGELPVVKIKTPWSTAEIYLLGAHITHFQKTGEPPLLFLSKKSDFKPGKAIRGGVPICYPWFGSREGDSSHGFARNTIWKPAGTSVAADGAVTVRFLLPEVVERADWKDLRTEFVVTVAATLTMELISTNQSAATLEIENCLHSYFRVGDIDQVSITGLQHAAFLDNAAGGKGERKVEHEARLRINQETNRIYPGHTGTVEIIDPLLRRVIRVDKEHSRSTVVWNPWTTQKLPDDFDPVEHKHMLCVESGNVKPDTIRLDPKQTTALKVTLGTASL